VNTAASVPETPATVKVTTLSPLVDADTRHCTVVPLDHADVAQSISPSVPVGVKSVEPNASPLSVAVSAPLYGMLELPMRAQLATGAAHREKAMRWQPPSISSSADGRLPPLARHQLQGHQRNISIRILPCAAHRRT
jgi:hypothetical protein